MSFLDFYDALPPLSFLFLFLFFFWGEGGLESLYLPLLLGFDTNVCIFFMPIVTRIPLDAPVPNSATQQARPPWIRPVRRKRRESQNPSAASSSSGESRHGSPAEGMYCVFLY